MKKITFLLLSAHDKKSQIGFIGKGRLRSVGTFYTLYSCGYAQAWPFDDIAGSACRGG